MTNMKSDAQAAYEEDVRRAPIYADGAPRKRWHELDKLVQWTWERNPTPRNYGQFWDSRT